MNGNFYFNYYKEKLTTGSLIGDIIKEHAHNKKISRVDPELYNADLTKIVPITNSQFLKPQDIRSKTNNNILFKDGKFF